MDKQDGIIVTQSSSGFWEQLILFLLIPKESVKLLTVFDGNGMTLMCKNIHSVSNLRT